MIYINLIIVFIILVMIHEFGHYIVARFFGAKVTDFSIGFGKALFRFTDKNGTTWKIAPIPLGGYVKIKGLDSIFSNNPSEEEGSFQSLLLFQKILVLLAGSFFNILSVFIIFFSIYFFSGSLIIKPVVTNVLENSAAFNNDIKVGDHILEINGQKIFEFKDMTKILSKNDEVFIKLKRDQKILDKNIELNFNEQNNRYILGISSSSENGILKKYSVLRSFNDSVFIISFIYSETFKHLSNSFKNNNLQNDLAGPIGIVKNADKMMLNNLGGALNFFIIISLSISLLNLLPIPLLDGGHIVYFIIRRIFSNSLPEFVTRVYLAVGITIISFLFIVITYNDIFYK